MARSVDTREARFMNDGFESRREPAPTGGEPAWHKCDLFCIDGYAGAAGQRCGWRGRLSDVSLPEFGQQRRCPRCGRATLLHIPLENANTPEK